jgi:nucleoside-diphosphate-sugar epimerase
MKNVIGVGATISGKNYASILGGVYGPRENEQTTFAEDYHGKVNFTSPRACYDEGKRFAESMAITYRDFYKLPIKIARVFRTYGPRMLLDDGQMIPDFIVNALDNKDLVIFGNDNFTTTLAYAADIVDGLQKIMESDKNDIYNLGSEVDYRLSDVVKMIIEMTGVAIPRGL